MNFRNTAPFDFTIDSHRTEQQDALNLLDQEIKLDKLTAQAIIAGETIQTEEIFERLDPNNTKQILGRIHFAQQKHAEQAIEQLKQFHPKWQATSIGERSAILRKAAQIMDENRADLNALIIRESGKPWLEADRDTVEAIDFCNYYASEAEKLVPFYTQNIPGEKNLYTYRGHGVAVIIGPWNFPLAIPCGMLVAALVSGNVAILKPAEQSSLIAQTLVQILFEAGLPEDALAFLPGHGHKIGPTLVESPNTQLVCFTGSLEVGKQILASSAKLGAEHRNIKKCILELGGKNAIIIDEDADLDQAIKGLLYSAFAYSGQKCSACSRVIVVGEIKEAFLKRLAPAAEALIIGPSFEPASFIGPVIDQTAQNNILEMIKRSEISEKVLFKGKQLPHGNFVPPTIFNDVDLDSDLWNNEIFGPVLAIASVKDFDQAIKLANSSKYALTGGIYSRSPANIKKANENLEVGNLYVNRPCTGAIVGRQPFGGFKLSGIGSKAGGPDYLRQFVIPKVISENTMRRGFTPNEEE